MKKTILISAALLLCGIAAFAQNTGESQDLDALVQQNKQAVQNATQNYQDRQRTNNRLIDKLQADIDRDQSIIDRLKVDLKAAKDVQKRSQDALNLQNETIKYLKKNACEASEIKAAQEKAKLMKAEVKKDRNEVSRINKLIKNHQKSITASRKEISALRKDTRSARRDMNESKKNLRGSQKLQKQAAAEAEKENQ